MTRTMLRGAGSEVCQAAAGTVTLQLLYAMGPDATKISIRLRLGGGGPCSGLAIASGLFYGPRDRMASLVRMCPGLSAPGRI